MKIANIVHDGELVNHKEVEFINYYKGPTPYSNIPPLPTLYVGWKFMKKSNPDNPIFENVNILKHMIKKNQLYWEFSFNENKSSHVNGVESFVSYAPDFYFNSLCTYKNIDPVYHQIKDTEELFDVLPKEMTKVYIFKDRMVYIYYNNIIYGLDLEMYRFFKFNVERIKRRLKEKSFKLLDDIEGEKYQEFYKIFPKFTLLKRYIVALY